MLGLKRHPAPLIIGLTGGIAMGKSTVAAMLAKEGLPVLSADAVVHHLLAQGGKAVKPVALLFPEVMVDKAIDRTLLGNRVFKDPCALQDLEAILHPLVAKAEIAFIREARRAGHRAVVLEIPLLYETGAEERCDTVIAVTVSRALQEERVMQRPGMTKAKMRTILARQMGNTERLRRANFIIDTEEDKATTRKAVRSVLKELERRP